MPTEAESRAAKILRDISTGDPVNWADIWIAKNYSKRDLYEDLSQLQDALRDEAG